MTSTLTIITDITETNKEPRDPLIAGITVVGGVEWYEWDIDRLFVVDVLEVISYAVRGELTKDREIITSDILHVKNAEV